MISSQSMRSGLIDKKKGRGSDGEVTAYWDSILDKMNIETCLANRGGAGRVPSIPSDFIGCSSSIPFFFAFDNHNLVAKKRRTWPVYIPLQKKVLQRLHAAGKHEWPARRSSRLRSLRPPNARGQPEKGRSGHEIRGRLFPHALLSRSGLVKKAESDLRSVPRRRRALQKRTTETFQDYIFSRADRSKRARLHLPVHFHSAGRHWRLTSACANGNPLNLEKRAARTRATAT